MGLLKNIKKEHLVMLWNAYVLDNLGSKTFPDKTALIRNYDLSTLIYHQEDNLYDLEDEDTIVKLENGDWYTQCDDPKIIKSMPFELKGKIIGNMKLDLDDTFYDYLIDNDLTGK